MKRATSRRAFVKLAGSGAAAFSLSAIAGPAADRGARPLNESPLPVAAGTAPRLSRKAIEAEIRRRAQKYLAQDYLEVDYYRIGRRLAYPLPIRSLSIPSVPVPSIPVYPWATWMTWELEERVTCLGWAAEWFADADARRAAERDLAALAEWPEYRQYAMPDLSSAHAGRILWRAHTQWRWLDDSLRKRIAAGCQRHVENVLPESDRLHGELLTKEDVLRSKAPHGKIHNIPFIGTVGAALAASVARHAAVPRLNQRLQALFGAILDLRSDGVVEGVSYDGYVLDFVADWLGLLPAGERNAFLNHPNFPGYLQESYMLAAPGTAEQVAELSDVEPREMPFHLSAQTKLHTHQPDPVRAWHLGRCRIDWLRADALAALHRVADDLAGKAPPAGILNAHYALVLRSGWEAGDLAVAVSNTRSPMGHIQNDNGSLTLGTHGHWLVTDPGYQQYVKGEERDFTLGPAAHNAPVVNGSAQNSKQPVLVSADANPNGICRAVLELGKCYPAVVGVKSVLRTIWLTGKELVVVADQVEAKALQRVAYHWHGHPTAAWWSQDGWIRLRLLEAGLWITSPQAKLSAANIQRLPGSRGQLTLVSETEVAAPAMWWVFSLGEKPPSVQLAVAGLRLEVAGRGFNLRER